MNSRKARVLFVNDTARNGGPGRSLYYILKFLDPARVHRSVVLPRPGVISGLYERGGVADDVLFEPSLVENPIEPWTRAMARDDFEAPLPLKAVRASGNVVRGASCLFRLAALVRRGRYDLVYCNGTNACFAGGGLARLFGIPALWHVRYTSVPPALERLHASLAKADGVRRIVCVSEASASLFPHVRGKVSVIHNALDPEEFGGVTEKGHLRRELGLPDDALVFGSQGRVLPRKGYMEMIRAAGVALARLPEGQRARTHFVVLGDTPEDIQPDHLAECRALVQELRLGDQVHLLGFREDVRPYVADFDVAVVPSVYPDPLPRAVIEAMACEKPVVAYDVGGVAEMLSDGETGRLVKPVGDVAALADAFVAYAADPALRARQGKAGRGRVERSFDAATQAKKIESAIFDAARLV